MGRLNVPPAMTINWWETRQVEPIVMRFFPSDTCLGHRLISWASDSSQIFICSTKFSSSANNILRKELKILTYPKTLFCFAFLLFQRQLTHSGVGEEGIPIWAEDKGQSQNPLPNGTAALNTALITVGQCSSLLYLSGRSLLAQTKQILLKEWNEMTM